jgi:subtilisin family serine protease
MKKLLIPILASLLIFKTSIAQNNMSAYSKMVMSKLSPYVYNSNGSTKKSIDVPADVQKLYGLYNSNGSYMINALIKPNNLLTSTYLNSIGVKINSKIGSIWSVSIPIESLKTISQCKNIIYTEVQVPAKPRLNAARTETHLDSLHLGLGFPKNFTGKNVIVGVIDLGFDFTHPTFWDSTQTQARILKVWDQTGTGTPPTGYTYGAEYSSKAAIAAKANAGDGSHGTHVAGIAAGAGIMRNGSKTNHGCAPNADIVMVQLGNSTADAAKYIFDYATSQSKPAVINMSLGTHIGPHDGKSLLDQAFDAMVGTGKVLVGAAGNEGDNKLHIKKTFANDTLVTIVQFEGASPYKGVGQVDIWGDPNQSIDLNIMLINASGNIVAQSGFINTYKDTTDNNNAMTFGTDTVYFDVTTVKQSALNQKPNILLGFVNKSANSYLAIALKAASGTTHLWNHGTGTGASFTNETPTSGPIPKFTVGDVNSTNGEIGGTAKSVITVGAYTTTNQYTNISGNTKNIPFNVPLGEIAPFSSNGPTVDGRTKPEITAPGNVIISSVNSFDSKFLPSGASFDDVADSVTVNGKVFYFGAEQGTSMATPFVTGVIALMLEANPLLTSNRVKEILSSTARNDNKTGSIPSSGSNTWGWGKINPVGAVQTVLGTVGITNNEFQMNTTIFPNPSSNNFTIVHKSPTSNKLNMQLYDLNGRLLVSDTILPENGVHTANYITDELQNGVYFLSLSDAENISQFKLIIQK